MPSLKMAAGGTGAGPFQAPAVGALHARTACHSQAFSRDRQLPCARGQAPPGSTGREPELPAPFCCWWTPAFGPSPGGTAIGPTALAYPLAYHSPRRGSPLRAHCQSPCPTAAVPLWALGTGGGRPALHTLSSAPSLLFPAPTFPPCPSLLSQPCCPPLWASPPPWRGGSCLRL